MNNKFNEVKIALEEKTKDSGNWLTITKSVDCRHSGKYALQNIVTRNVLPYSYDTLDEIIKEYGLNV